MLLQQMSESTELIKECDCTIDQNDIHTDNLICYTFILTIAYPLSNLINDLFCDKTYTFVINIVQTMTVLVLTLNTLMMVDDNDVFLSYYTKMAVLLCLLDECTIHLIISMMDRAADESYISGSTRISISNSWILWGAMSTIWSLMRDMRLTMQAWMVARKLITFIPTIKSLIQTLMSRGKPLQALMAAGQLMLIAEFKIALICIFIIYQLMLRTRLQGFILYYEHIEFLTTVLLFRNVIQNM